MTERSRRLFRKNNVPKMLYIKKGFVSIGCAPCTRAIAEGEDIRKMVVESSHKDVVCIQSN
jgi:phosphoadenosine phosphosulfate reductase